MLTRVKIMCVVIFLASTAGAQNETVIPIVEVSDAGAPVTITGQVKAIDKRSPQTTPYTFNTDLTLDNTSRKAIILVVTKVDVTSTLPVSLDYSAEDDYFFESKILQPGSVIRLQQTLHQFGEPLAPHEPSSGITEPSARAKVAFVQFLDGSTWGDASAAERLLRARRLSLSELENLQQSYQTQGEDDFVKALLKPTVLQPVMTLQNLYREKHDVSGVVARLNEMLENAHTRSGL